MCSGFSGRQAGSAVGFYGYTSVQWKNKKPSNQIPLEQRTATKSTQKTHFFALNFFVQSFNSRSGYILLLISPSPPKLILMLSSLFPLFSLPFSLPFWILFLFASGEKVQFKCQRKVFLHKATFVSRVLSLFVYAAYFALLFIEFSCEKQINSFTLQTDFAESHVFQSSEIDWQYFSSPSLTSCSSFILLPLLYFCPVLPLFFPFAWLQVLRHLDFSTK